MRVKLNKLNYVDRYFSSKLDKILNSSVGWSPDWCLLDTADTWTSHTSNFDVTRFSPAGTPWVSDDVKWCTVISTVTNGCDGVIKISSALKWIKDTTLVHLEDWLVGLNGDRNWSQSNSSQKLIDWFTLDIVDLGHKDFTLTGAGFACIISSSVWIVTS